MTKFKAEECKNLQGVDVSVEDEQKIIHVCTTQYCVDRNDCNGEIVAKIPDVHFEPIPSIKEQREAIKARRA